MLLLKLIFIALAADRVDSIQFQNNPNSEMSSDDKNIKGNKTADQSDESGHEVETDAEEVKEKKFLDDAMKTVLDPSAVIVKNDDIVENIKIQLEELDKENSTLDAFMDEMDKLSLEVCKTSSEALWSYVTDINNESKKNAMMRIAAEEDETKKQYWNILKQKYLNDVRIDHDLRLKRKIRIIRARGSTVQMPQSKQREEIDIMQRIWSRVAVCAYNVTDCSTENTRTMNDIITVFKTSNDTKELAYYWKAYRDGTGRKIRPIFKDYVTKMNDVAKDENFTDAGEMWRYVFEDDNFVKTVDRIWSEIKPLYERIHNYVRSKLKTFYAEQLQNNDDTIPAHILGNLWAQEWQPIYPKVAFYPDVPRPMLSENGTLDPLELFDAVDDFHQSLGFETAKNSYQEIKKTMATANCLPSSHDMCDGVNYRIKWCGGKLSDVTIGLSRAARLLSHVQYFKHYSNLPPLFRDGPMPAFHDAISDIAAVQLTSPDQMKALNFTVATGSEAMMNHLLWLALEKFPLMAYAYVLDKWRWDVFANNSLENWNGYWWELRTTETGISPPVRRNESDLDPAAKYHVASHVQYITYLISPVLEFQILLALCKKINHTGPLNECYIRGQKEAGKLLSDGMALGATEDWRTVLQTITGETELSTKGILEYFAVLNDHIVSENARLQGLIDDDMDQSAPIIVGVIVVVLTFLMVLLYCVKKRNVTDRVLSACGLRQNGSLDIVTSEMTQGKTNETVGVREDKV